MALSESDLRGLFIIKKRILFENLSRMEGVILFLKKKLLHGSGYDANLKRKITLLLEELEKSKDIDYRRFFISLAIDLKWKLISKEHVWDVLNEIDFNEVDSTFLSKFDKTIVSNLTRFYVNSPYTDAIYEKGTYTVLLYWTKLFIKYRNAKGSSTLPISWSEEEIVHRSFFYEKTKSLSNIDEWAGWKGIVWVLPLKDLQSDLKAGLPIQESINEIIDKTGLNPPHASSSKLFPNDELLYIEYPSHFSEICFQPTTLSGFWLSSGGLYLSFLKKDGYGRTFSITGKPHKNMERIHSWSNFKHSDFKLISIGEPNNLLKKEISEKIILEALMRFKNGTK